MKEKKDKVKKRNVFYNIILRLSFMITFSFVFGIIGFIALMLYGGNYGCFSIIDKIFYPLRGYESCGYFGSLIGLLIGAIAGEFIFEKVIRKTN